MGSPENELKETEMRPDHLLKDQRERYLADVARLLERKDEFVVVGCPACESRAYKLAFKKYDFEFQTCLACETMYISPRPTPALLEFYYSTSQNYAFWNEHIYPASEAVRREKIFRPRVGRIIDICRRHGIPMGSLLEVGAGFGTFNEEMVKSGAFKRVVAVEPTPGLAETCRGRGLEVIERPIERAEIASGSFDVAVSFEVVEHLFSPADYIKRISKVLAPRGLLILTCPNLKGFDVEVLGKLSSAVDSQHLNYFHPASLSYLAASSGLEVVEVQTPGKLDAELVRKRTLAGEIDLSLQPFLRRVLIDEWDRLGAKFQDFLAENGLSSHMWLVARKPR